MAPPRGPGRGRGRDWSDLRTWMYPGAAQENAGELPAVFAADLIAWAAGVLALDHGR